MYWTYLLLSSLLVANSFLTIAAEDEVADVVVPLVEAIKESSASNKKESGEFEQSAVIVPVKKEDVGKPSEQRVVEKVKNVDGTAPKTSKLVQEAPANGNKIEESSGNNMFIIVVAAASLAGFVGILMAGVCYYKFRTRSKAATEVGYPAYGETGPNKERVPSPGDRKLAQSAQMYHYQHQKQQMIAMEKANGDMKHDASDDDSEEDNIEGDYTVYECPGLAPTGEMEVKNPLFRGEDTPVNPSQPSTNSDHGVKMPHDEEH